MKNIVMIFVFALFSGAYSANAQEGKTASTNKTACCSSEEKKHCAEAKASTGDKVASKDTSKPGCETGNTHSCVADGSCCAASRKEGEKPAKKA